MKILAIDTSTDYLSLAVMDGEKAIAKFHKKIERNHSRLLVPTIDKLLKKARLKLKDIDGFCISIGPGSFTGLRIGATAVKGLAYALRKPIVTVPTLDIIAQNGKKFKGIICPVLDARKNKFYACLYKSDGKSMKRVSGYLLAPLEDLAKEIKKIRVVKEKIIFLGDVVDKERSFERSFLSRSQDQILLRKIWYPKATIAGRLGLENFRKKRFVRPEDLEPLYLYSKECDIKGI